MLHEDLTIKTDNLYLFLHLFISTSFSSHLFLFLLPTECEWEGISSGSFLNGHCHVGPGHGQHCPHGHHHGVHQCVRQLRRVHAHNSVDEVVPRADCCGCSCGRDTPGSCCPLWPPCCCSDCGQLVVAVLLLSAVCELEGRGRHNSIRTRVGINSGPINDSLVKLTSCSGRPPCSCSSAEDWRGQIWCRSYWSANRIELRKNKKCPTNWVIPDPKTGAF